MLPVPDAVNPVMPVVAVAVHENVAPLTLEVSVTAVVAEPEQIVCVNGLLVTTATGLTVTI